MKNEDKSIEVMADLLAEVHEMRTDTSKQLTSLNERVDGLGGKMDKLEGSMTKMNLHLAENSRAILKLADFGDRIIRLENTVFKKTG